MRDKGFKDRGVMLLRTIEQLPVLVDLDIGFEGSANGRPVDPRGRFLRCQELAELHSRTLTSLVVTMLDGSMEGNTPLQLNGLPELRSCDLLGDDEGETAMNIRIDAESFNGAPQLQSLCVSSDWTLQLQDGSLAQLTALTSLRLNWCGLRSVPADIAWLSKTLCELNLIMNYNLQLDKAAVARIVQCSRLQKLSLHQPDFSLWQDTVGNSWQSLMQQMHQIPSLWSSESVSQLVLLPSAFHMRHGRYLQIIS